MERCCGLCCWCCEEVTTAQKRYVAADGTAVHAECMEEYLLEVIGERELAETAGYEYRREEDTDA